MKKLIALILTAVLALTLSAAALADTVTIAVPNDPTNEGRALLLLQSAGVLTLKSGWRPPREILKARKTD